MTGEFFNLVDRSIPELNTADISFSLVVVHKKFRSKKQMYFIMKSLVYQRQQENQQCIEEFVEDQKLLTPNEIDRVLRTRWKHARKCKTCKDLTYLLPKERSEEIACEHCGEALHAGRLDGRRRSSRTLRPKKTTKNYYLLKEDKDNSSDCLLPQRIKPEHDSAEFSTKWDSQYNVVYDAAQETVANPAKESETIIVMQSNEDEEKASFLVVDSKEDSNSEVNWQEELIGTTLGRYTIIEKIAEGGIAVIFRAHNDILMQDFVIKILKQEFVTERRTKRLIQEAQACMNLAHPNIVKVYGVDKTPNNLYYVVMEYVDGLDLQKTLEAFGAKSWRKATKIVYQVAQGLAISHQANILHRDIKPANILLPRDGGVKITDFGLAKKCESSIDFTAHGVIIGTPLYMAPEVGLSVDIDLTIDIYCLGLTFYYMLVGKHPFADLELRQLLNKTAHRKIPKLDYKSLDCPPGLINILSNMLAFAPEQRYQSTITLLSDLGAILQNPNAVVQDHGLWAGDQQKEIDQRAGQQPAPQIKHFRTLTKVFKFLGWKGKAESGPAESGE
jgi:serine/threonine protein kinase